MSFNLDEYVDVAERIRMFAEKFPEGSLQGEGFFVRDPEERLIGYHYQAKAYRTADDARPGVGTAYEPIPGKTPYTRDSEVMNAESSAWGRAIVALGFSTKKIASANEVRARQTPDGEPQATAGVLTPQPTPPVSQAAQNEPASPSGSFTPPPAVVEKLAENAGRMIPQDGGVPEEVVLTFGAHKGKKLIELLEGNAKQKSYLEWLASDGFTPESPDRKRVKGAVITLLGGKPDDVPVTAGAAYDDSIPFAASWA